MSRNPSKTYPYSVTCRLSELRFQELQAILKLDSSLSMGELVRRILDRQKITVHHVSNDISPLMEVLSSIDSQVKKIDTNLNLALNTLRIQISSIERLIQGKKVVALQQELKSVYQRLEVILEQLQIKWLS